MERVDNPAKGPLQGLRVLSLEDNALIAMSVVEMLRDAGARTEDCTTIEAAIHALRLRTYDVALLDLSVHGELSFAVAKAALERDVPIIFVTGYGVETLPRDWQGYEVCEKPYSEDELCRSIKNVVSRSDVSRLSANEGCGALIWERVLRQS